MANDLTQLSAVVQKLADKAAESAVTLRGLADEVIALKALAAAPVEPGAPAPDLQAEIDALAAKAQAALDQLDAAEDAADDQLPVA
jgi:hypothetical protein